MTPHPVSTRAEWLAQRTALLEKEKAFNQHKDELAAARRALPWVKLDKDYSFDTDAGPQSLAALFGPHSQLMVYHFMFNPKNEQPCKSCSFWADNWSGAVPHLTQRDVSLVAVSRAPLAKLSAFKKKQGWDFSWVSSGEGDFNYDFAVSFRESDREAGRATYNYRPLPANASADMPGFSVFKKTEDGSIYHTYSTFGRGIDVVNGTYQLLDLTPDGRNEAGLQYTMAWLKYGHELVLQSA